MGNIMKSVRITSVEKNVNHALFKRYLFEKKEIKHQLQDLSISVEPISPPSMLTSSLQEDFPALSLDRTANEILLFHGTSSKNLRQILQAGFDERLSKKSGLYGEGTYFTDESCKAFQYTEADARFSSKGSKREGCIILARVALGDIYYVRSSNNSRKGERAEPLRDPEDQSKGRFNSVVANVGIANGRSDPQAHREFILHNGKRAYPDLVVYFEVSSNK